MNYRLIILVLCAAVTAGATSAAQAVVTLPAGDIYLDGTLEFLYAEDGSARIDAALYVDSNETFGPGALAEVYAPPGGVTAATGLGFDYAYEGSGNDTLRVAYTISNDTGVAWTGLRFLADVSGDPFDLPIEVASVHGTAVAPGDPQAWGIDDFYTGDLFVSDFLGAGLLDNSNGCGNVACAAEGALQWNLDALAPGERWVITVLLSDAGVTNANRWLEFALHDGSPTGEVLTFSGQAVVVPLPGVAWLFAGLAPLVLARRRVRTRRPPAGARRDHPAVS
ncbi:MAG: hypothetical protein RLW61_08750 [Gammaproteobacteria bacterium]